MAGPIVLLTDFGHQDPFVGIMKGRLAALAPRNQVIDLCHEVPPQDVRTGALFLKQSVPFFPKGTVFLAVVDPGVGSARRAMAARSGDRFFVGPDNGLLSWVGELECRELPIPKGASPTFHGRDVFAPAAARIAKGGWAAVEGPRVCDPVTLPWPKDEIVAFDRFGNAITSVAAGPKKVRYRGRIVPVLRTYAEAGEGKELAVVGSSGLIELSVRNGNFAAKQGAKRGDRVQAAD